MWHGTGRVQPRLVARKGHRTESLFVAAFTDKAARELRTGAAIRLNQQGTGSNLSEMYPGTFHPICLHRLRHLFVG